MFPRMRLLAPILLATVLHAHCGLRAHAPPAAPDGWTDGYVWANGIRIHYWRTGGDGLVLVMAHGFSDDGLTWTNLAKEFAADYDIIMVDARGHGRSDPPTATDPVDVQVEDLAGFLQALGLEHPILMGHSMGSASVAWFAARYPEIPQAVILEDPRLIPRPPQEPGASEAKTPEELRDEVLARNNMSQADLVAECLEKNPGWGRSEAEYWAASKRQYHPNTRLRSRDDRPAMKDLLSKITAPTLILKAAAEGDTKSQEEAIASLLPSGRIVHVDGAGHCVRRDRKQRVIAEVQDFLGSLD